MARFAQLGLYPEALGTVAILLALLALVPGLPFLPFVAGACALGTAAWMGARHLAQAETREDEAGAEPQVPAEKPLGDMLDLDDIHIQFAPDLVAMVLDPAPGIDARIGNMRSHVASVFGLILPEIRLTDDAALPAGTYVIRIQGVEQARDQLRPQKVLVLLGQGAEGYAPPGEAVEEPVYGAPARWVSAETAEDAALGGMTVVHPTEVLAAHLLEVIKRNFSRLLSMKSLRRLLDEMTNLSDEDRAAVLQIGMEALRFNPMLPLMGVRQAVRRSEYSFRRTAAPGTARVKWLINRCGF